MPQNGIYKVSHRQHRLPEEVTLLSGELFPPCARCSDPVIFRWLRKVAVVGRKGGFRIVLHQLPAFDEVEDDPRVA